MKKILLYAAPFALALAFSSCDNGKGGNLEERFGQQCLNLINDKTGQTEPSIARATYSFHINYTENQLEMNLPSLEIGDKKLNFSTNMLTYKFSNYSYNFNVASLPTADNEGNVTDLVCRLTSIYNVPEQGVTGDMTFNTGAAIIMKYDWNDYSIVTFPSDAVYTGETTTTAPGSDDYTTNIPKYRFMVNAAKNTASLIIYNGRFSDNPKMPALNLILEDLKVVPQNGGYSIVGENVVPKTLGEGTPYEAFTFATLKMNTLSTDLTSAQLFFSINSPFGELTGSFSGSYLIDTSKLN